MTNRERELFEIQKMNSNIRSQTEAIRRQTEEMRRIEESRRPPSPPLFSKEQSKKIAFVFFSYFLQLVFYQK